MERDTVQSRAHGRLGPGVPLVQLEDPSYEERPHLVLVDDQERHSLARAAKREEMEDWTKGLITTRDRRQAKLWGAAVALAAMGGLVVSALDLILHLVR